MNTFLFLISIGLGLTSLYFAGLPAAVASFFFGCGSALLFHEGNKKIKVNAIKELRGEPEYSDIKMLSIGYFFLLMSLAISAASVLGEI